MGSDAYPRFKLMYKKGEILQKLSEITDRQHKY